MSTRDLTVWVCTDCNAAVAGTTSHEAGHPLPIPFDGDASVLRSVNGSTDRAGAVSTPWRPRRLAPTATAGGGGWYCS